MSDFETALGHHKAGRLGAAREAYEAILAARPDHLDARHHLALIAVAGGDLEQGIALLRETVTAAPGFAVAWVNLGLALGQAGAFAEAATALARARDLLPDQPDVHVRLGDVLAQLDRFDEAAESYRAALRLKPDLYQARFNLAMVLKNLGRLEAAAKALQEVLALRPEHVPAQSWLGRILLQQGRHAEGLGWLTEAGGMIAFSAEPGRPFRLLARRAEA